MVAVQKQVTADNVSPLEFMSFLADAPVKLYVIAATTGMIADGEGGFDRETWQDAMYDIVDYLELEANGRFWCGLGREDAEHFTDDQCEIAIYLADPADEACIRRAYAVAE